MEANPDRYVENVDDFQTVNLGVPMTPSEAYFPNPNLINQEPIPNHENWFGNYEPGIVANHDFDGANAATSYQFQADALQNSSFQSLLEFVIAESNCYNGRSSPSDATGDSHSGVSQLSGGQVHNSSSGSITPQFAPETPDQITRASNQQYYSGSNMSVPTGDIDLNVNLRKNDQIYGLNVPQTNEDLQLLVDDQPSARLPVNRYEYCAPDKGGGQSSEFIKTPQQKSRKKNPRPKIRTEENPKRTPKPKIAPERATPKRKYVRRGSNTTTTPPQNKTGNDDLITTPGSEKKSVGKRKYVRRKGVSNPDCAPLDDRMSINGDMIIRHTRSSCGKSLNFETENPQINDTRELLEDVANEMPVYDQMNVNKALQHLVDLTPSEGHAPCPSTPFNSQPLHKSINGHQTECSMAKYQIFSSDASHDKEVEAVQTMMGTDIKCARKDPCRSNCNRSTCMTQEIEATHSKIQHFQDSEAEICSPYLNGVYYNSLRSYEAALSSNGMSNIAEFGMNFPTVNICKSNCTSGTQENQLTSETANTTWIPSSQCASSENPSYVDYATLHEKKISNNNVEVAEVQGDKRKRPRGRPSGKQLLKDKGELIVDQNGSIISIAPKKKRKRSKKNAAISPSVPSLHNHPHSLGIGAPLAITWEPMSLIDEIIQRLSILNINAETSYPEQNALVVYQRDGSIVPFSNASGPVQMRKQRPKVDLDEDIKSEGIDGTDEEKARWWEEERRVFAGRADSFISRMHLVQGDRRFTPWKGSIVDSVVGVFLTQNVSDHLSSSAFMALAARYPPKSSTIPGESLGEKTSMTNREPQVHVLEPDDIVTCHVLEPGIPLRVDESAIEVDDIESTQNSLKSWVARSEKSELNSLSMSEEESSESERKLFNSSISFVELMRTVEGNTELEEVYQSNSELNLLDKGDWCCAEDLSSQISNDVYSGLHQVPISGSQGCSRFDDNETCTTENIGLSEVSANQTDERMRSAQLEELAKYSSEDENSCFAIDASVGAKHVPELVFKSQVQQQTFSSNNLNAKTEDVVAKDLQDLGKKPAHLTLNADSQQLESVVDSGNSSTSKAKGEGPGKQNHVDVDWDALRKEVQQNFKRERTADTMDSLDWEAIRCADVKEISNTIKMRGMNNMLAERIKGFLERLVREHGSIDLEWLRDVLPDKAKEYLLSYRGLGLKSVECVRLLTLQHHAFPVDVNVGRIVVRLGWVPLQPFPESVQLHLLDQYPVQDSIQKYLWPRLCKLDQRTLYELHYQMITFGKVFCTKTRPNCNACPMRGECKHFASAFACARLTAPAPEEKGIVASAAKRVADLHSTGTHSPEKLFLPHTNMQLGDEVQSSAGSSNDMFLFQLNKHLGVQSESSSSNFTVHMPATPEPNIEEPPSPEPEQTQFVESDMEDFEDTDEIPTIRLNVEQFAQNLENLVGGSMELQDHEMSQALVALTAEAASLPTPKLKNINRLRTEHQVYELPVSHPLLHKFDRLEHDDPCSYLLAIWTPGETANSIHPPEIGCKSQETGGLCDDETCYSCNSIREANSHIVRGTILVPCRTAMRGRFPLNGTYYQVNEVFADHESSLVPVAVPRAWIWNLPRRTVYFGTSIPAIFKGMSTEEIQYCFWRAYVCVRGIEQCSRAPKPLIARLHFPASKKNIKGKAKVDEDDQ